MRVANNGDLGFAFFSSGFAILLGLALGVVFEYSEPAMMESAQSRFDASGVNLATTATRGILEGQVGGPIMAPAFFVVLLLVNNLAVAGLIAFNSRFLNPIQSIIITSGALFSNGFITGTLLVREVLAVGFTKVMPIIGPYWGLEMVAYIIAGAIGYYAIMHGRQSFDAQGPFIGWIVSLLAIGGGVEALIVLGP